MSFNIPYVNPKFQLSPFNCAICNAFSHQKWEYFIEDKSGKTKIEDCPFFGFSDDELKDVSFATSHCKCCNKKSIWIDDKIVYPIFNIVPLPHHKMNEEVKELYIEASNVYQFSPRSSCMLLRLALQRLLEISLEKDIGTGDLKKDLEKYFENKEIGKKLKKVMDSIRIIGNENAHKFYEGYTSSDAMVTFNYLNLIFSELEVMEQIDILYQKVPEHKRLIRNN